MADPKTPSNDTDRVYDLPTRLFHWIFALLFVGAFFIAKTIDDDSAVFSYHMMLGLALGLAAALRVIWGFVGSRYARFSSFDLNPSALLAYFANLFTGGGERKLGHNPASSWSALAMIVLALGLAITGVLMAQGGKETYEDIHELLANSFVLVVLAHIAGIVLHTLRHRDGIGLSMLHGRKRSVGGEAGIVSNYPLVALAFVGIMTVFGIAMANGYDPTTRNLQLFGSTLQLGESEDGKDDGGEDGEDHGDHEDDDDDD